jgi:hypothetical protein
VAALLLVTPQTANAGCKKFQPSGPLICASWITGSTVCDNLIRGIAAKLAKDCEMGNEDACLVEITCTIYGTQKKYNKKSFPTQPDRGCEPTYDMYSDTFALPLDCEVPGILACANPNDFYNPQGTAFNYPGPLSSDFAETTCYNGGKCEAAATIDLNGGDYLCPNDNWSFIDFTAQQFFGEVQLCPGGFDAFGEKCCADGVLNDDGTCKKEYGIDGKPGKLQEFCYVDPKKLIKKDDGTAVPGVAYTCGPIGEYSWIK